MKEKECYSPREVAKMCLAYYTFVKHGEMAVSYHDRDPIPCNVREDIRRLNDLEYKAQLKRVRSFAKKERKIALGY